MTVREWFRIQRGALYLSDNDLFWGVVKIATNLHLAHNPWEGLEWIRLTPTMYIIADVEEYTRRQRLLEAVRADMDQAMRRLLRVSCEPDGEWQG